MIEIEKDPNGDISITTDGLNYQFLNKSDGLIYDVADEAVRLKAAEKKAFWWSAEFTHAVHRGKILEAWRDYLLLKLKGVI